MPRPDITEWVSVVEGYRQGFLGGQDFYYFLGLMVVAVLLAGWARWREITPALVLLVTFYLGVAHNRHRVFFALTFGAYMPALLTAYFRALSTRPGVMTLILRLDRQIPVLVVILLLGFFTYRFAGRQPFNLVLPPAPSLKSAAETYYPLGALDYLEQHHLSGKLLVHFNWGQYCLWRLYPQCRVAIDGRYETVYPERVNQEYFDFLRAREGWRNFLVHYPPDLILIALGSRIHDLLSRDPEWRQVYADPGGVLFRRQGEDSPAPARVQLQP